LNQLVLYRLLLPFLETFAKLRQATIIFRHVCLSVPVYACNTSTPTGRIFVKFCICGLY